MYFLNAVTEADLKALAEQDGFDMGELEPTPVPERTPVPVTTPQPTAEPEPEKSKGGIGGIVVLLLVVAGVVGAGYYFKIYQPRLQQMFEDEEYGEGEEYPEGGEGQDANADGENSNGEAENEDIPE